MCKAYIRRCMYKNRIPRLTEYAQRRRDTAQHTIFITNVLFLQVHDMILRPLPVNDRIEIFLPRPIVSIGRMRSSLGNQTWNRRHRWKIHIRNPHRDLRKPSFVSAPLGGQSTAMESFPWRSIIVSKSYFIRGLHLLRFIINRPAASKDSGNMVPGFYQFQYPVCTIGQNAVSSQRMTIMNLRQTVRGGYYCNVQYYYP